LKEKDIETYIDRCRFI